MNFRKFTYVLVHCLGFIFCPGMFAQDPSLSGVVGWKNIGQDLRVSRMLLEPIVYEAGPDIDPYVHAYLTFEMVPGDEIEYLNARLSDPSTGISLWLVENVPLPHIDEPEIISYTINVEAFGPEYNFLRCEYNVSNTGQADSQFSAMGSVDLVPEPTIYNVPSGSNDPALSIGDVSTGPELMGSLPGLGEVAILRALFMPNIDLDYSKDRTDSMACGPAAAANSLHWLVRQHKELANETSSVRAKLDSLKKYMNRGDKIGVRFDSMVVGKLTLIDKLKLPISVKYKTKHESGNTDKPLASTEPPAHTADNQGKLGEHPDLDWIKKEIDDGEDVEVHVGWYGPPDKDGKRERKGGHWLVATGYSTAKGNKGIYLKDDDVQGKPGGMRHKFYKWENLPGGEPYLKDLKDRKGNIAIVESAVSESYDPTVTFEEQVSGPITEPWSEVALTGERMKPGYAFLVPVNNTFPWIPIIAGVAAASVVTYVVTQDNNNPTDCTFTPSSQISPSTCELPNGAISISVTPADQYQFLWSTGSTESELQNIIAGSYLVTITRTRTNCQLVLPLSVTNTNPSFNATITTQDSDCGQQNGSAIVNVNPAASYTYTWSNGGSGEMQNNLAPGKYSVTISAGGACAEENSLTIGELPPTFEVTVSTTPSECGLSNGTGNILVNPDGDYTYEWSNGSTGQQVMNLPSGTYNVTVTLTGTHCSKVVSADVGELPPAFDAHAFTTPSECGQSTGTGTITVNPPGDYSYEWSNGSTGQQVMNLPAGLYNITVTLSGTHCSKIISTEVLEHLPTFDVTIATTPSGCSDSTGTATISVDPTGEYIYEWANGLTGSQVTGLHSGNYLVTITIAGTSCSKTITVTIGQTGVGFTATLAVDAANCGVADGLASITVDPAGEYTYLWSNQQTGPVAQQLMAGNYSVTVTDMNGCSSSFSTTIAEDPADYITIINTIPGNCIGGGDINFSLTTPGTGPLNVQVVGPGGNTSLTLVPGAYLLSTYMNVLTGTYTFTVFDEGIGTVCMEVVSAIIMDITLPLVAINDFYLTLVGETITGNMLDNDSGLNLQLTMVTNVLGGIVTYTNSGEFTFTPDPGFTGDASFTYTVTDACGMTATAVVTIMVEEVICDFNIDVTSSSASCGLSDGSILVDVIEQGNYTYLWDNGTAGPEITDIPAGSYTITIEEVDLGCSLEFTIELPENPADYIDNLVVTQPACGMPGEISFVASNPGMNDLLMSVDHPNGNDNFFIEEGPVFLSDYVPIVAGEYTVEITDPEAGPDCVESFTVNINPFQQIEIAVEAVIPPSEPTGMDGAIVIVVTLPGTIPYSVFLNGIFVFNTNQNTFNITGLGVGHYMVQIIDASGCESNILEVDVPLPDMIFSFGTGVINTGGHTTIPEQASIDNSQQWNSCFISSLQYFIGKKPQELRFYYTASTNRKNVNVPQRNFLMLDYLSEIASKEWKQIYLKLQGGIGVKYMSHPQSPIPFVPQHWKLSGNLNRKIGNHLQLQCSASVQGWKKIEQPIFEITVMMFSKRISYTQTGIRQ